MIILSSSLSQANLGTPCYKVSSSILTGCIHRLSYLADEAQAVAELMLIPCRELCYCGLITLLELHRTLETFGLH